MPSRGPREVAGESGRQAILLDAAPGIDHYGARSF